MAFPDFLCIGAQRTGTTWLHSMLSQHPNIYLGPIKEYHYFSSIYHPEEFSWARPRAVSKIKALIKTPGKRKRDKQRFGLPYSELLDKLIAQPQHALTEAWYSDVFSFKGAADYCKGDITPSYSALPPEGVRHVKTLLNSPRIIYIIRDPLSRLSSNVRKLYAARTEKADGPADWESVLHSSLNVDRGDYQAYVPRWEAEFSKGELMYIPFLDIVETPLEVLKKVERHIGVEPYAQYRLPPAKGQQNAKVEIPGEIMEIMKKHVAPQYDFLKTHFPPEFVARV